MTSEVDRELAKIEERRAEEDPPRPVESKGKIWSTVKRIARDMALRRVSTKR